jgi:hypothetical protein
MTKFYCLRFESSPTWRARSPYLYPPGTGLPGYTPRQRVPFSSPCTTGRATVEVFDPASKRDSSRLKVKVILRPTVSRPVCLGTKHPFGAYDQILITCVTVTVLFLWGALSDERTDLFFVCAAGPCQRSLSQVRVPWDLRLYFTVSDLRLPFSSPPTTRRVTVEVFDPPPPHGVVSRLSVGFSLYNLGTDLIEYSDSGGSSIFAFVYSLPWKRVYRLFPNKDRFFWL